jgi:hypothetical protein
MLNKSKRHPMLQAITLKRIVPAGRKATRWCRSVLPAFAIISFGISDQASAQAEITADSKPIDGTLYATYSVARDRTHVSMTVCGSLPGSSGCYGSADLGPFNSVGAVLEGLPSTDKTTNTVTRDIYVLDTAAGPNKVGVSLYVYSRTDIITGSNDSVVVVLTDTVALPLIGSTSATASMAANSGHLYIGTNKSPQAVAVVKKTLAFTQIGGFSPPVNVSSITADEYGFVTVTYGSFNGTNTGFLVFGPDGSGQGDGGGASFTVGTAQAVRPPMFK